VFLGAPKDAPVRLRSVADESGTIKGTVTDLVPEGGKPPKDGVYTLVVAVSDRITDSRYASGTFVVQVIGAPFHGDSLP
jgi:hypothetical protein